METNQTVVVITGMHRSGTSLTTSLLQSAGMFIGDRLLGNNLSNPRGHFEDLDFVEFHQQLLQAQGLSDEGWMDNRGKAIPQKYFTRAQNLIARRKHRCIWGWKDPRTTLFLNFWSQLLPNAKYVFVYRSPWEVVDSLYRRGDRIFQTDPALAIQTWINYNQKILHFCTTTAQPWILLPIEDVINFPQFIINSINQQLALNLRSPQPLYDDSLFQISRINLYQRQIVQKNYPQAFNLYLQLHSLATRTENYSLPPEIPLRRAAWLWQNWLDRPLGKIKTLRYWWKLK